MKVALTVASMLLSASLLVAQGPDANQPAPGRGSPPSLFPSGYLDHDDLTAALRRLAEARPERVQLRSLAKSGGGRDVWLVTLGRSQPDRPPRPALLLVANLEADHIVGSQVALGLIGRLAAVEGPDFPLGRLLEDRTVYVVPRLNPDGAERILTSGVDLRTNLRAVDRDRDGRQNEDGPEDLNGDGVATRMRIRDAKASLVADKGDRRIQRKANAALGEWGAFSEYAEGIDDDGDGQYNEDPPGGVNLNRNWPHRWAEFDREAGFSPASEPEVRALIQFAFDHPEIAIVWSFGLDDNLRVEPRKPGSTLDDADLPLFAELSRLFNKTTAPGKGASRPEDASEKEGTTRDLEKSASPDAERAPAETAKAPSPDRNKDASGERRSEIEAPSRGGGPAGSPSAKSSAPGARSGGDASTEGALSEWAYHQYGVVGLASRLWAIPEIPEPEKGQPKPPGEGEARWLYWNDRVLGGRAFIPFEPFDHPTLGRVEIGGWRPGVRLNPPIEQVEAITRAHLAFLEELGTRFAKLEVPEVKVEAKGGRLYQLSASVENSGYLPTALAQGLRTRKAAPILVRLRSGDAKILAGKALNRIDGLAGSGGRKEFRWLLEAPGGVRTVVLEVSCPKAGSVSRTIELASP